MSPESRRTSGNSRRSPAKTALRDATGAIAPRTLLYIPIIHTQADMGGLAHSVQHMTVRTLGRRAWSRNVDVVDQLWADIRATVQGLKLPWTRVRLYQDGLPVCGCE